MGSFYGSMSKLSIKWSVPGDFIYDDAHVTSLWLMPNAAIMYSNNLNCHFHTITTTFAVTTVDDTVLETYSLA